MTEISYSPNPESNDPHQLHSESFADPKNYAELLRKNTVANTIKAIESSRLEDWYLGNQDCLAIKLGENNRVGIFFNPDYSIDAVRILADKITHELEIDSEYSKAIQAAIGQKSTNLFIEAKEEAQKIVDTLDMHKYEGPKFHIEDILYQSAKTPKGYSHCVETVKQVGVAIKSGLILVSRSDLSVYRTIPFHEYAEEYQEQKVGALGKLAQKMATNSFFVSKVNMEEEFQKCITEATTEQFISEVPDAIASPEVRARYSNQILNLANKILKQAPLSNTVSLSEDTMEMYLKTIPALAPKQTRKFMSVLESSDPNFKWIK